MFQTEIAVARTEVLQCTTEEVALVYPVLFLKWDNELLRNALAGPVLKH